MSDPEQMTDRDLMKALSVTIMELVPKIERLVAAATGVASHVHNHHAFCARIARDSTPKTNCSCGTRAALQELHESVEGLKGFLFPSEVSSS